MHAHRISISVLLLSLLAGSLALAEESTIKQDAKQVGRETGEVAHKIGEGGKEAGKKVAETARDVGHATRDAAKEVGKKVADTAVEVGHATRDGAKELGKAARGETSTANGSSASAHKHKAQ
jgi:F0F1-type ATP synthase membrane subunit b/b'